MMPLTALPADFLHHYPATHDFFSEPRWQPEFDLVEPSLTAVAAHAPTQLSGAGPWFWRLPVQSLDKFG